jgi:undecaprenyl diphosphate synthase
MALGARIAQPAACRKNQLVSAPKFPKGSVPHHVAVVMDGNGRWAKQRGLPRTAGHEAGEAALFDMVEGAIDVGVKELSAYAFSTENWKRSPDEVKFLMGFNRDVIRRRRDQMHEMGVRVRWVGKEKRLWKSVLDELLEAEELTKKNKVFTLNMCVNYGGRSEIVDATTRIAADVAKKKIKSDQITEKLFSKYLYNPGMSDVDLFLRSSGEQRTSNFLPWQSVYAEMVFMDVLWPDVTRKTLWDAIEIYNQRERRFGKA